VHCLSLAIFSWHALSTTADDGLCSLPEIPQTLWNLLFNVA